jgi:hypothetical protein
MLLNFFKLSSKTNIKFYFINFILIIILIVTCFAWSNHNDFMYYGSAATTGKLYKDIYFSYPPGSYFFNKFIFELFNNNYNYFIMRMASIFYFIFSINILANFFIKNIENKFYFLILTTIVCGSAALEIGSYSLSFLFFSLCLVFFFKNNNLAFFLAGFFFSLCLIVRPTYIFLSFFFLIILLRKLNFKFLTFSLLGSIVGVVPYLIYLYKDFESVFFWNFTLHSLFNEVYRWKGLLNFLVNILGRLYSDYIVLLPLILIYLHKHFIKSFNEFLLIFTLALSSLAVLTVHKQYFEPLFVILLLFIFKYSKTNNRNRFVVIFLILVSLIQFLYTYQILDKNKYSKNNLNSFASIMDAKSKIQQIVQNEYKDCNIIFRTTSSSYLPISVKQHPFNIQGIWLYRIKDHPLIISGKFFDYSNFINLEKNDFNSILVGFYPLHPLEKKMVEYAQLKKWKLYNIGNFNVYINSDCKTEISNNIKS